MQRALNTLLVRVESVFAIRVRRNQIASYETIRNVLLTMTAEAGGVMRELQLVVMVGVNPKVEV